jgi:hypothetical protein
MDIGWESLLFEAAVPADDPCSNKKAALGRSGSGAALSNDVANLSWLRRASIPVPVSELAEEQ